MRKTRDILSWLRVMCVLAGLLASMIPVVTQEAPSFPDSAKGLQRLVEALQQSAEQNDMERFRALTENLHLHEADVWFVQVFGDRFGPPASRDYAKRTAHLGPSLVGPFKRVRRDGYERLEVERLRDPCSSSALQNEYPVLFARKEDVPLYSVRYRKGEQFRSFGFFAYVGGDFRYLGHIELEMHFKEPEKEPVKVAGVFQQAKLIERPAPKYPVEARRAWMQGTVRLNAIIGRDGTVQEVLMISGHCSLAKAAIEAVRKWRYTPTLIGGKPVEVFTTIDVVFTLSQ